VTVASLSAASSTFEKAFSSLAGRSTDGARGADGRAGTVSLPGLGAGVAEGHRRLDPLAALAVAGASQALVGEGGVGEAVAEGVERRAPARSKWR